jgi:transcription elongation GreA/GreB family factor
MRYGGNPCTQKELQECIARAVAENDRAKNAEYQRHNEARRRIEADEDQVPIIITFPKDLFCG